MKKDIFALTMAVIAGGMVVRPAYAGNNASSPVSTFASAEEYCTKEASNLMFTLPPLGEAHSIIKSRLYDFCMAGVSQAGNEDALHEQQKHLAEQQALNTSDLNKKVIASMERAFRDGWNAIPYITGAGGNIAKENTSAPASTSSPTTSAAVSNGNLINGSYTCDFQLTGNDEQNPVIWAKAQSAKLVVNGDSVEASLPLDPNGTYPNNQKATSIHFVSSHSDDLYLNVNESSVGITDGGSLAYEMVNCR